MLWKKPAYVLMVAVVSFSYCQKKKTPVQPQPSTPAQPPEQPGQPKEPQALPQTTTGEIGSVTPYIPQSISIFPFSEKYKGYRYIQTPLLTGTLSYYSRISHDGKWIVYTQSPGFTVTIQSIEDPKVRYKIKDGPMGDGIFSPDGKFMVAIRPHASQSRHYYFYLFNNKTGEAKQTLYRLMEVSGYPTIAIIPKKGKVNPKLEKFRGKYLVLGKTLTYMIVDIVDGELKILAPTKLKKNPKVLSKGQGPLCMPPKSDPYYKAYTRVLYNDAYNVMLAKNARYVSLAQMSERSIKVMDTFDCTIIRELHFADGRKVIGGKATFSYDSRYLAFHAFGESGEKKDETGFIEFGKLKRWAMRRQVINIFIYDIFTNKMVQVTNHTRYENTGAAVYPDWTDDNQLVFNYHQRGERYSKIRYYPHVIQLLNTEDAFKLAPKSIVKKSLNEFIQKKIAELDKVEFKKESPEEFSILDCKDENKKKAMLPWQLGLCSDLN